MRIAVVGAGLSCLTFAAMAAKDGHEVVVFDKNQKPGGVAATFDAGEFKFEQGPLILGDILPGEPLYNFLKTFDIELPVVQADRGTVTKDYALWKPDEFKGYYWRKEELKRLFPEDVKGIDEYYRFYDALVKIRHLSTLKQTPINKAKMAFEFLKIKKYKDWDAQKFVDTLFENEKIKIIFTGIMADYCAEPSECTCFMIPFINIETAFDVRSPLGISGGFAYFEGGCQKLPEALAEFIENHGGKFNYGTIVEKVVVENGKATGVVVNGERQDFDFVVGCGSAKDFFKDTVGFEHLTKEYREIVENYREMEAVFMLHLGVDIDPMQYQKAALCYYYGDYDLHRAITDLRTGVYHEGRDGYLISVPSWHAKDFAPEGKYALTIYTIAPAELKDGTWEEMKEEYADKLIKLAEQHIPELSKHIVYKKIMTNDDYKELMHQHKGSFGGAVPIMNQKLPPRKTPIENLVFLGAQSENGGGISAVIFGARDEYNNSKLKR